MSAGDIAVLVILLLSALLAFIRGFVREVLSIAGWVGAALVTIYAFPKTTWFLRQYITIELLADLLTGVAIFVVTLIVLSTISHYIAKGVRGSAVNAVDRSLGFVFGLARGAVLVCLAYLLIVYFYPTPSERPEWVREAKTQPWLERGADALREMVPASTLEAGTESLDAAREQVDQGVEAVDTLQRLTRPSDGDGPPLSTQPQLPTNDGAPEDEAGYNQPQRNQLDRLIENSQ